MNVGQVCSRQAVTMKRDEDLTAAAALMREKHIGYIVVVDSDQRGDNRPVGVLTDRDIVVSVIAGKMDPSLLTVGDVMKRQLIVTEEQSSLDCALLQMRRNGIRRLPVLGGSGSLVGVLSLDDALEAIAGELSNAAGSIRNEQRIERSLPR